MKVASVLEGLIEFDDKSYLFVMYIDPLLLSLAFGTFYEAKHFSSKDANFIAKLI